MRAIACDTLSRYCARRVFCWSAFPLVPALGSTDSAADGSALFVGFMATMAESDFPMPTSAQYGGWPDAGPPSFRCIPFARDVLLDPGRTAMPRVTALLMLRSTISTASAPATCVFRGSITNPTQLL